MYTYVMRRFLLFVPSLLGVTVVIFVLMRMVPGDVAEIIATDAGSEMASVVEQQIQDIRAELGLDLPYHVQYLNWMRGLVVGHFVYSYW